MRESGFSSFLGGLLTKNESLSDPMRDRFNREIYKEQNVTTTTHTSLLSGNFYGSENMNSAALFTAMVEGAENKANLIKKLNRIKSYDYVETLLRDLATDVLTRNFDPTQEDFFSVNFLDTSSRDEATRDRLTKKLNKLIEHLNVYDILMENMEEYLFIGQYVFKMDLANDELDDSLNQSNTLPAYSKGKMVKMYDDNERLLRDTTNYLTFNLFSASKKTRIKSASGDFYYLKLPRGIIPESVIQKIMNLKLLESLQPLIELQAVDEKMVFNVRFPPGKDVKEAYAECRNYERLLTSLYSLDKERNTDNVDDIIQRISQVKVVPLFGNEESMTSQNVNKINRMELSQLDDLRKSISNSLKIKIDGDNSTNTEYYKLIKRIRTHLKKSMEHFIIDIAKHKYNEELTTKDFEVIIPDVQGAEDIDAMEYLNLTQSTQKQVLDLVSDTVNSINTLVRSPLVNSEELIDSLSDKIFKVTGIRIIKSANEIDINELKKTPPPNPDGSPSDGE
jgi:hypothetical protein